MDQVFYSSAAQTEEERNVKVFNRQLGIRLQWIELRNSLLSFAIGGVLGSWMNNWKFDIGVALMMFIFVYYVIQVKSSTDCGVIASVIIVFAVTLGIVALTWKFEVVYMGIMLVLCLLPFAKGVVIPVVKLCKYAMSPEE